MAIKKYKIADEAKEALGAAVRAAMLEARSRIHQDQRDVGELYTGTLSITRHMPDYERLPAEGLPAGTPHPTTATVIGRRSTTAANLFYSRLRQVVVQTTPLGIPAWRPEALVGEAVGLVEDQQTILDSVAASSGMEYAVERIAALLPTQNWYGVRARFRSGKGPIFGAVEGWEIIEASHCGYEPHHHRFSWHTYTVQAGDAPTFLQDYIRDHLQRKSWENVTITEVFHGDFDLGVKYSALPKVPTSFFVSGEEELYPRKRVTPELGELVVTTDIPSAELYIDRALDPAPNEDLPPSEVSNWIPIYKSIIRVLDQILHEVETTNSITLYERDAFKLDVIEKIQKAPPGEKIFAPVDTQDAGAENPRGVNATMRPVERNSALSEYIATLNILLSMYDDVTGVGPLDRGLSSNPEKSATEAAGLFQAAGDRRRDRLRVIARTLAAMGYMFMARQRKLLGSTTTVVLSDTQSVDVRVPDAPMAIRLNSSALENMSRADSLEAQLTMHTTLVNDAANFQSPSALRMLDESRRRLLKKMGWKDIDQYMDIYPDSRGPFERYIKALHTGEAIKVLESDNHATYIQTYADIAAQGDADEALLQAATVKHQRIAQRLQAQSQQADPQAPIPGVSATGGIDNQVAAGIGTGNLPLPTPQAVRGS